MNNTIDERLTALRNRMSQESVDLYIVTTADDHGSEYICDYYKAREFISGFTGSAGTVLITAEKALIWVDGRYYLQAEQQLRGTEYIIMRSGMPDVPGIMEYIAENSAYGDVAGFDGRTISCDISCDLEEIAGLRVRGDMDLIGDIWTERPGIKFSDIWLLDEKYHGESSEKKFSRIRRKMSDEKADILLLTSLEEIAWTLNMRACDVEYTPVFMAFMLIKRDGAELYAEKSAMDEAILSALSKLNVEIYEYEKIYDRLSGIQDESLWMDFSSANDRMLKSLNESVDIIDAFTPVMTMKAVKNAKEQDNIRKAHILDGVAKTKFIYWLKNNVGSMYIDELSAAEKLRDLRKDQEAYLGDSFETIVGYGAHGAIVHYTADEKSNIELKPSGMVLVDSGGHYLYGTTDVTRTISLGPVSEEMRTMYTTVLKGNLNLAMAVFKKGTVGAGLDTLAREPLWKKGIDFNHGTGHGVGYILSVHESPNSIRYRLSGNPELNAEIVSGMVTSDEPGYYKSGEYGIRIEDLILCVDAEDFEAGEGADSYGPFYRFDVLTMVPYDKELIDVSLLDDDEKIFLKGRCETIRNTLSPYLTDEENEWLYSETDINF